MIRINKYIQIALFLSRNMTDEVPLAKVKEQLVQLHKSGIAWETYENGIYFAIGDITTGQLDAVLHTNYKLAEAGY